MTDASSTPVDSAIARALAAALAGEYAAVWAYGLIGARSQDNARSRARSALTWHRNARDQLRARTLALGLTPAPPAPAYQTGEIADGTSAAELAQRVELSLVPPWSDLAAVEAGDYRASAAGSAQVCAARAVSWGAQSQARPGISP